MTYITSVSPMIIGIYLALTLLGSSHSQDFDCYCLNHENHTSLLHCSGDGPCTWQFCGCWIKDRYVCESRAKACTCSCTYGREFTRKTNLLKCWIYSDQLKCSDCKSNRVTHERNFTDAKKGEHNFNAKRLAVDPVAIQEILRYHTLKDYKERTFSKLKILPFIYNMTHQLQCLTDFMETCTVGIIDEECPPELTLENDTTTDPLGDERKVDVVEGYGIGALLGTFIGGAVLPLIIVGIVLLFLYRCRAPSKGEKSEAVRENASARHDYSNIGDIKLRSPQAMPSLTETSTEERPCNRNFHGVSPPMLPHNPVQRRGNPYGETPSDGTTNNVKNGYHFIPVGQIETEDDPDYSSLQRPTAQALPVENPSEKKNVEHNELEANIGNEVGEGGTDSPAVESPIELKLGDVPTGVDNHGYYLVEKM